MKCLTLIGTKSQITPLKNNYNGATPDSAYISGWNLTLDGLASGLRVPLDLRILNTRFSIHEQITRLVCVEGWSAIAWWAGLRFDDLLRAYPPMSQAKWARVESSVNLDDSGNPDPYFMSIDLATARHPQTLLATHFNGQPLTVDHGAPLRLLVPVDFSCEVRRTHRGKNFPHAACQPTHPAAFHQPRPTRTLLPRTFNARPTASALWHNSLRPVQKMKSLGART